MASTTRITEMYAFVVVDPVDKTEGIVSFQTGGMHMPMVGADTLRVEALRPMAQKIATAIGVPVEVIRFTVRDTISVIEP